MSDAMRIRTQATANGKTIVRVLMSHDMESGQRKDAAGQVVPAWHIRAVVAALNGTPVLTMHWGPAISKNPLLQFNLKSAKAGDRITITWVDTKGDQRSDEAVITAA
jgi:sulfur-oxidizing protein SoxZ